MINYAHRGASEYYPENTLSSFYAGVTMGAAGIETDIHRTKDGVLVLFHDDTLDRVTDHKGNISDYTFEELQDVRVHDPSGRRWDKITSLEHFLQYFGWRDLTFAIELKQDHVEKETIDMLEAFHMREKTVLTSFNFESIRAAKEYCPGYRVGYLYRSDHEDALAKVKSIGGEELCPKAETLTPELAAGLHAQGYSVRAWGVYNDELMKHVCRCGADGMTVNFPDRLAAYLAQTADAGSKTITLRPASREDMPAIWKMQIEAFSGLLDKYRDFGTSPGAESLDKVMARFEQPWTTYYYILAGDETVGVIRVVDKKDGSRKKISPIWIMQEYRDRGYAQAAITAAEEIHGPHHWELDTILQEPGNNHLYVKMGYHRTGRIKEVNDRMSIVFYEKD